MLKFADETMAAVEGGKRRFVESEGAAGGSSTPGDMRKDLDQLKVDLQPLLQDVGEGIHKKPLWKVMAQCVVETEKRTAELEACVYKCFEVNLDAEVVRLGMEQVKKWQEACKASRGVRGGQVGACTNYVFAGFMVALCGEKSNLNEEEKKKVAELVLARLGDARGAVDLARAVKLTDVVGHAKVRKGKAVAYVHYKIQSQEFAVVDALLEKELLAVGKRVTEPPAPHPSSREIKRAVLS